MTTIFTDGSSRGNPGPGRWAAIVIAQSKEATLSVTELGGAEKHTTNNRMELTAAVKGIEAAPAHDSITVFTDSSYVINGITKWIKGWKRNGWQTKLKEDVLNKDLWMELDEVLGEKKVKWQYVGGHVGILGNERCDHIATAFADGRKHELYSGSLNEYDIPNVLDISLDEALAAAKKSKSSRAKGPAFSYISMVKGVIEVHKTWAECEKRVKGAKGARFKKAMNAADEALILGEFETAK